MFMLGYTVEQIANERSLAVSTIEGHLVRFVENGELDASRLIDETKLTKIHEILDEFDHLKLNDLKEALGTEYTYCEIKAGIAAWRKINS